MKNKAINALIEMGMPANIKGFRYIVEIMVLFENESWRNCKTTALYQKIAMDNKTTYSRVERCIRHAFEIIITKGDLDMVKKYLTLQYTTSGNLLHTFYLKLAQEE